jgi:hypothetical protein
MARRVHKGKTSGGKRAATVVRRRAVLAGSVLAISLGGFAAQALSSSAATVPAPPRITGPTVTVPTVTAPRVTVPKVTTPAVTVTKPPVTVPAVTTPTVTTPTVTSPISPVSATPTTSAPAAPALSASALSPSTVSSEDVAAARQLQVRSLVIRFSQCLVTLQPQAQSVLLLRAGIEASGSDSPSAVAHSSHISRAREARVENAALVELQSAAHEGRCASALAALIHVPAQDRLVSTDPVLNTHRKAADRGQAARAELSAVGADSSRLSFGLTAVGNAGTIKTLTVALPSGISFSSSKGHRARGVVVDAHGKRVDLTTSLNRDRLTIKFKRSARSLHVTITAPALRAGKSLQHQLEARRGRTLQIPVTAVDTGHQSMRVSLK